MVRRRALPALLALLAIACGPDATTDAGPPRDGGAQPDAASDAGSAEPDAGADAGPSAECGDGVVEGAELCDDDTVPCTSLTGSWASGDATCRAGCDGYDVSACASANRVWEVVKPALRDDRWASARCNDGTPFAFAYRPGAPGSTVWVIHLQGGGWGDDNAFPFAARPPEYLTTLAGADGLRTPFPAFDQGIFAGEAQNPDFHDAHHVRAQYCSSDLYSGRGTARRPVAGVPEGYWFAGRPNVRSMFEILAQRFGLDDADPGLRVLYGGESAGMMGATATMNIAVEHLPRAAADGRLRLMADGAYLVTYPEDREEFYWGEATDPDATVLTDALAFWDGEPLPACDEAQPGACYLGRGWYPAITETMGIPTVVLMSTMDVVVLGLRGVCTEGCTGGGCFPGCGPLTTEEYAEIRTLHGAEWSELGVDWLFAWGSTEHTVSVATGRWNGPAGATEPVRGLVADFFFDRTAPRQVFVNGALP